MESLEDSREALVLVHMKTKATGLQCQLKMAGAEVWTVQTHSSARAEGRQAKAVLLLPQSFSRGSTGRHCPLHYLLFLGDVLVDLPRDMSLSCPDPIKLSADIGTQGEPWSPAIPSTSPASLFSTLKCLFLLFPNLLSLRDLEVLQHPHLGHVTPMAMTSSQTWVLVCCFGLFFSCSSTFSKFESMMLQSAQM